MNMENIEDKKRNSEIFGKMPAWYVKHNIWSKLSRNEMRILGVLFIHQNNISHRCSPSLKKLAAQSGVCKSSISKVTKSLEDSGLIQKWPRWNHVIYEVKFDAPPWLVETGKSWDLRKDRNPKTSESYRRSKTSGKFLPKNAEKEVPNNSPESIPRNEQPPTPSASTVTGVREGSLSKYEEESLNEPSQDPNPEM